MLCIIGQATPMLRALPDLAPEATQIPFQCPVGRKGDLSPDTTHERLRLWIDVRATWHPASQCQHNLSSCDSMKFANSLAAFGR